MGGGETLNRFWWLWHDFQGHTGTLKCLKKGFCALSSEPVDGFLPNLLSYVPHILSYIPHCWQKGKSWLDFGDLGLIFKVTLALWNVQNIVSVRYLNQWVDFDQTSIDTLFGGEEVNRFWWPWPNCQGHTLWNVQNRGSVRSILSQWMDFDQTCIDRLLGEEKSWIEYCDCIN